MSILSEMYRKWQNEMSKIMLTALYTKNPHVLNTKIVYKHVDSVDEIIVPGAFRLF